MSAARTFLSGLMIVLGVLMLIGALTRGGGPLAMGVLMGLLFVAAGAGRLWLERRR